MAARSADSMTNAQGEFSARKPRDEPLQKGGVSTRPPLQILIRRTGLVKHVLKIIANTITAPNRPDRFPRRRRP